MNHVLITGANGYIGRHLIKIFAEHHHSLIGMSRSGSLGTLAYDIDQSRHRLLHHDRVPDTVIHLAWDKLNNYHDEDHFAQVTKHLKFLEYLLKHGVKNIIVLGTCFEYGLIEGCLNETMPCKPITNYASAKYQLYQQLLAYKDQYAFNLTWLRLFYIYGDENKTGTLFHQLDHAIDNNLKTFNMSPGNQLRDYLDINTVCQYIHKIALTEAEHGIVNLCSGKPLSIETTVKHYLQKKLVSIELNLGYYDYAQHEPMAFWGDTHKLHSTLKHYGFQVKHPGKFGLNQIMELQ